MERSKLSVNEHGHLVILSSGIPLQIVGVAPVNSFSSGGEVEVLYGFVSQIEREA